MKPNAKASRSTVSSPFSSALTAVKKEATVWSISKWGTSASTLERANFTQFESLGGNDLASDVVIGDNNLKTMFF